MKKIIPACRIIGCLVSVLVFMGVNHPMFAQNEAEINQPKSPERGIYWWSNTDFQLVSTFADFKVKTIAFRLGKAIYKGQSVGADGKTTGSHLEWESPIPDLSAFPTTLSYRPIVEISQSDLKKIDIPSLRDFIEAEVQNPLNETSFPYTSIELKINGAEKPEIEILKGLSDIEPPVQLGIPGNSLAQFSSDDFKKLSETGKSIVVYFLDYDYSGLNPKISERAWIDSSISLLNTNNIPFTLVLPVYKRAVYYPGGVLSKAEVISSIDLSALLEKFDVTDMGTAGQEIKVTSDADFNGFSVKAGDKLRIINAIDQIKIDEIEKALPTLAQNCREIDLFRFPLVPRFDSTPDEILKASGWIQGVTLSAGGAQNDPMKEELDKKHNSAQQIIFMVSLALMTIIMMRMFSKGIAASKDSASGEKK